jgi:hypothetical protein
MRKRHNNEEWLAFKAEQKRLDDKLIEERRVAFEDEHEELLSWLRCKVYGEPDCFAFLETMADVANTKAKFTDKQLATLKKLYDKDYSDTELRNNSKYLGKVGEYLETTVTVINTKHCLGAYGQFNVVTMHDVNKNVLVYIGSFFNSEENTTFKISALVKEHKEYREIKQTKINRIKILETVQSDAL